MHEVFKRIKSASQTTQHRTSNSMQAYVELPNITSLKTKPEATVLREIKEASR